MQGRLASALTDSSSYTNLIVQITKKYRGFSSHGMLLDIGVQMNMLPSFLPHRKGKLPESNTLSLA
jgi:hypothetical protein